MDKPFEILEHTADVGVRAFGRTLPELYENAARGMLEVLLDPASVKPAEEETVVVTGTDAVDLLVVWLHEILLRTDARKRAFAQVRVSEVAEWRLVATLSGEAARPLAARAARGDQGRPVLRRARRKSGVRLGRGSLLRYLSWIAECGVESASPSVSLRAPRSALRTARRGHHGERLERDAGADGPMARAHPARVQGGHADRRHHLRRRAPRRVHPQGPGGRAGGERRVPAGNPGRRRWRCRTSTGATVFPSAASRRPTRPRAA